MLSERDQKYSAVIDGIISAAKGGIFKKAIFSKPADKNIIRTVITYKTISGKPSMQTETFMKDNKVIHRNFPIDADGLQEKLTDISFGFCQIDLITTCGDAELRRSKNSKITVTGLGKIQQSFSSPSSEKCVACEENNRKKSYILDGSEPFLKLLGVSDAGGRVYDKKQPKYRQINRFLEHIRDIYKYIPKENEVFVLDLCCGKSYLTFAVYHYLVNILGRKVTMHGVDLKPDVIEYCSETAKKLDFDGLSFFCEDIREYRALSHPHLVISLHACDTATDVVIDKAINEHADVILSTPCCHHELNRKLDCSALDFIAKYSMLRQKLCDAATDSLRLMRMEMNGYSVDALELIDPDDTPKNILLRGIRKKNFKTDSATARSLAEKYQSTYKFLYGKNSEV